MSQSFYGAEPKVVKNKSKFNQNNEGYTPGMSVYEETDANGQIPLNIMYDKRVFRGNTHNFNLLK
jgi:hypothetical protein